jgi:hypothetical protein
MRNEEEGQGVCSLLFSRGDDALAVALLCARVKEDVMLMMIVERLLLGLRARLPVF